ncbi:MAG: polyprenyl synthetase family protein [Thermofilum sp.]|nr:polyprenyl synthetase family protein [Thermofilum sp.]
MQPVLDVLGELGKAVDPVMTEFLVKNASPEFHEAVLYQIRMGGKRVRPALTIACCLAVNGKMQDALHAAAAVELAHNYSLILDDIIDHSELRRGLPTLWKKYGISTAILVAVHYRETISQVLNHTVDPALFNEIMAETIKLLTDGERLDILFEQAGRTDEPYVLENRYKKVNLNDYLCMIERKTAKLIETSCVFGALSARASEGLVKALREYGYNLGMAFQIGDDIIDIFGKEEKTGKKVGGDIKEHKLGNIVVLLALEELGPSDKERVLSILRKDDVSWEEVSQAIEIFSKTNAREKAEKMRKEFVSKAMISLQLLPQGEYRDILLELAEFIEKRDF